MINIENVNNSFLESLKDINDLTILCGVSDREKFSKDFYDYSPILKDQLKGCIADIIVKPYSIQSIIEVAKLCYSWNVPLTLRGSGTGNYGQCVPLKGGVVMTMSELNKIRSFNSETAEITVESGCKLRDIEKYLASHGRQLRLLPSTWRSASAGGFLAGGSGGIGSIRWGFLRDPGNLIGLEIVTINKEPKKLLLGEKESEPINHAYGTNGIITALTLATAPLKEWQEISIDCDNWSKSIDLLKQCSYEPIDIYLGTLLQKEILDSLPNWSGNKSGAHRLLMLVAGNSVDKIKRLSTKNGGHFNILGFENQQKGSGVRELTWNHTTLHFRAVNPNWTYLQMLLPNQELNAINYLNKRWPNDLLWHLEAVKNQGTQRLAALPLVRWRSKEKLEELMNDCKDAGAILFNPHTITVEDGGLGVVDIDQVAAKRLYDPKGILNPGKLRGWN